MDRSFLTHYKRVNIYIAIVQHKYVHLRYRIIIRLERKNKKYCTGSKYFNVTG